MHLTTTQFRKIEIGEIFMGRKGLVFTVTLALQWIAAETLRIKHLEKHCPESNIYTTKKRKSLFSII